MPEIIPCDVCKHRAGKVGTVCHGKGQIFLVKKTGRCQHFKRKKLTWKGNKVAEEL